MAKITIYENDTTVETNQVSPENVAFIPGYAIKGPSNTPTLCTSFNEFISLFGAEPYTFLNAQTINGVTLNAAQTYEKSYIYARELIRNGLPIMFYRYVGSGVEKASASYTTVFNVEESVSDSEDDLGGLGDEEQEPISNEEPSQDSSPVSTEVSVVFTATALYEGKYANGYVVKVGKKTDVNEVTYNEIEILVDNVSVEKSLISFDPQSKYYFANFKSNYITISIDGAIDKNETLDINAGLILAGGGVATDGADEFNVTDFYTNIVNIYSDLSDRATYELSYITTGAYPILTSGYETQIDAVAKASALRGDCVSLLDPFDESIQTTYGYVSNLSLGTVVRDDNGITEPVSKYCSTFVPWAKYALDTLTNTVLDLPGSFGYLYALSESVKSNNNWYAVSGVVRGLLPNIISLNQSVTGAIADQIQTKVGVSINPIMMIRPYGYSVWGNRTLFNNLIDLSASSFLNIRVLTSDIKKAIYTTAKALTFEPNSDVLWLNFKASIEPLLQRMQSGNGISGYKFIRQPTNKKATLACKIRIIPIEAVEDWDVTVELTDSTVSVL